MLVELGLVEQRYQAVLDVLNNGATVTDVARRNGVSRQTVHEWLRKYAAHGLAALVDRSSKPQSCPHQMDPVVEARIVELRREHPGWAPPRTTAPSMISTNSAPSVDGSTLDNAATPSSVSATHEPTSTVTNKHASTSRPRSPTSNRWSSTTTPGINNISPPSNVYAGSTATGPCFTPDSDRPSNPVRTRSNEDSTAV